MPFDLNKKTFIDGLDYEYRPANPWTEDAVPGTLTF